MKLSKSRTICYSQHVRTSSQIIVIEDAEGKDSKNKNEEEERKEKKIGGERREEEIFYTLKLISRMMQMMK